ncbi:hypothetical protein TBLA_0G03180 [Henningerozyma blattae CBS 6284]|uniref:G-protein coupled receptors family 1 profile domain-containing protein n=1 Tax=Henningerozyma blattae (strain ATCC 34711 / CBS 6284 / DSM 70876 / NBRC 10599 / NRRL Y-10934 / UCD 77-7) TaxID=1071380 RepID=I2H7A3_HENB6|nr:hypothetical protein TBLA_0G03180 [Tetrapisispora blattae CBS 6284]CCH62255.1 hypothetical protein TBLA_0G03180 [Tetrapisispora blattae CBS 6284]
MNSSTNIAYKWLQTLLSAAVPGNISNETFNKINNTSAKNIAFPLIVANSSNVITNIPQIHNQINVNMNEYDRTIGRKTTAVNVALGLPGLFANFDLQQTKILQRLSISTAAASLFLGTIAVFLIASMDRRRKFFRHDLILYLIICDLFKALILIIFPAAAIARHTIYVVSEFYNTLGWFTAWAVEGADIAITVFAIHFALLIFRPTLSWKNKHTNNLEGGLYRYRFVIWPLSVLIPMIMASLAFIDFNVYNTALLKKYNHVIAQGSDHYYPYQARKGGYKPLGMWCYLPPDPVYYKLFLSWGPRYILIVVICVIYASIYIYITRQGEMIKRELRKFRHSSSTMDSRRNGNNDDDIENNFDDDVDDDGNIKKGTMITKSGKIIFKQIRRFSGLKYVLTIITGLWSFFFSIFEFSERKDDDDDDDDDDAISVSSDEEEWIGTFSNNQVALSELNTNYRSRSHQNTQSYSISDSHQRVYPSISSGQEDMPLTSAYNDEPFEGRVSGSLEYSNRSSQSSRINPNELSPSDILSDDYQLVIPSTARVSSRRGTNIPFNMAIPMYSDSHVHSSNPDSYPMTESSDLVTRNNIKHSKSYPQSILRPSNNPAVNKHLSGINSTTLATNICHPDNAHFSSTRHSHASRSQNAHNDTECPNESFKVNTVPIHNGHSQIVTLQPIQTHQSLSSKREQPRSNKSSRLRRFRHQNTASNSTTITTFPSNRTRLDTVTNVKHSFQRQMYLRMKKRRSEIRRRTRYIFIYPISYLILWIFPLVLDITQYRREISQGPVIWLSYLSCLVLPFNGFVDSLVFLLREKPWKCNWRIIETKELMKTYRLKGELGESIIREIYHTKYGKHGWYYRGRCRKQYCWHNQPQKWKRMCWYIYRFFKGLFHLNFNFQDNCADKQYWDNYYALKDANEDSKNFETNISESQRNNSFPSDSTTINAPNNDLNLEWDYSYENDYEEEVPFYFRCLHAFPMFGGVDLDELDRQLRIEDDQASFVLPGLDFALNNGLEFTNLDEEISQAPESTTPGSEADYEIAELANHIKSDLSLNDIEDHTATTTPFNVTAHFSSLSELNAPDSDKSQVLSMSPNESLAIHNARSPNSKPHTSNFEIFDEPMDMLAFLNEQHED